MDDLERYVVERNAGEPGFAALVDAAEARRSFSRELAERRRQAGLSQTQVAAAMETSASIVSRLEGGADVRISTLEKYVAALHLELRMAVAAPALPFKAKMKPSRQRTANTSR